MGKTEIQKINNHDKYVGGNEDVTIKWDGKTELINNDENKGYAYLHQTPPYRVRFKFTKDEITAIFDTACNILYHQDSTSSLQTNKETGHQDSYWFFGYRVGFEIYTSTNSNKIKCTNTWLWKNSNNAKTLYVSKKWKDIIEPNTNIESYLYAGNKVYFRPICQGCCRPKYDHPVYFIDNNWSNIGKNCVQCAKYRYVLEKAHQHIAKPEITLLKTTGTTIKIKASDGNDFEGILNTDSRYNDSTNNELLFTNLKKETTYTLTIRRKCSCGNYIYSNSKKIKTWNVILDDKKSLDVLNCGGYHRIHVAAKQKEGTRGINSNSGNDGIKYDLYNSINNGANIGTLKTSIDHNSGDNYYRSRGGLYSSIAKFTELDSNTYYYCKAYSIDNITNQDNTPDTIKESIFKTAKKFTVDNVSIDPKNDKVIIIATISNLDDTYFKKDETTYINGLDEIKINIYPTNDTPITRTFEKLSLSNINNGYGFNFSTTIGGLHPGTEYNIKLDFTGYSKYGIDHINNDIDINEICVRSIERSFTTASTNGEIINLESSIKAVKFDFKIDDDDLGPENNNEPKYKAILCTITETTNNHEVLYEDKYIETDNNRPKYVLGIPNNKFINFQDSNTTTKIIKGLSFGVFNQEGNTFTYFYDGQNNDNEHMDESVGIDCNTIYRIVITDNNNNTVAAYNFSTKQLEAKTNMIIMQNSIKVITKPIIINENFSENDFSGNTSNIEYKDTDTINTKSKIRTINNDQNSELNYSIGAYAHEDYRSFNDLNYYVDTSDNHDDPNAIFYNYIDDIDNQKIFIYKAINQEHKIEIINNDQDNQYDHTEIIHEFNNLTYFCYHKIRFYLTDGYNIRLVEVNCNTTYPYIAELHNYTNGVYAGYNRLMAYIFYNGEWRPIIAHTCKKYLDSNNQEYNKWIVVDGDIAYLI